MTVLTDNQQDQLIRLMQLGASALAQEDFFKFNASGMFKSMVEQVQSIFRFADDMIGGVEIQDLKSDQKKFLKLVEKMPYTSMGSIRAFRPEGIVKPYLELLHVLQPLSLHLKMLIPNMLQPYTQFLAQFVSDHQFSLSANVDKRDTDLQEKARKDFYAKLQHCYGKDTFGGVTTYNKVVQRNNDWPMVFKLINEVSTNLNSVNRDTISSLVQECNDYVKIILEELKTNKDRKFSQEAANRLAAHAHSVARELEMFATIYYLVLACISAIDSTISSVEDVMG